MECLPKTLPGGSDRNPRHNASSSLSPASSFPKMQTRTGFRSEATT
jgi:hypothetical protein